MDPNVGTAHERTRRLVVETNTENVQDSSQTRSCHESETFNVGDETLRDRSGQPVVNHDDSSHEQTRQNQAFHPFSPESKKIIQEVGNIELFELLETDPKTQCTACLSYWNVGIVYCTCGHFLQKETEANRNFVKYTMDFLPLAEYVIKKGRPHGHRYGKKPGDK